VRAQYAQAHALRGARGEDGVYEFEFREMTDAEVEALGEFEGW
jgi:hypothetical protein